MMITTIRLLLLSLCISASLCGPQPRGDAVLVSDKIADIKCLRKQYTMVFPRGYVSTGMVDPSYAYNVALLNKEKMNWWPYMQPCFRCGNPRAQAQALANASAALKLSAVNLVVDQSAGWSTTDLTLNQKFLLDLVSELKSNFGIVALMTSKYVYEQVVGKEWWMLGGHILYNQAPDGLETCKNYQRFGGWYEVTGKVFKNGLEVCGNTVDRMLWCKTVDSGAISA